MRTRKRLGVWGLSAMLLFAAGAGVPSCGYAAEPKWPAGRYNYIVIDQDLRDLLVEFGRNTKLSVSISEAVRGKRVRGEIKTADAEQFFKGLCASYGLIWYFDGSVLHVSSGEEVRTELIDLGYSAKGISEDKLMERLKNLGAADQRFPVKSTGGNLLSVSGPPAYIGIIRQTLSIMARGNRPVTEATSGDDSRVRVFRGGS